MLIRSGKISVAVEGLDEQPSVQPSRTFSFYIIFFNESEMKGVMGYIKSGSVNKRFT